MRRRFFVEGFEGGRAALRGEQAGHLGRVLRARPGQLCELSDGQTVWLGRVERVAPEVVEFALVERVPARAPALSVTLLLSIIKFDRFEWCLEKAAELGVTEIQPLAAARSETALGAAAAKRARRWEKILLESAQQARRLGPPRLDSTARPAEAFPKAGAAVRPSRDESPLKLLLSERAEAPALRRAIEGKRARSVVLAIGPEGGWTGEEFAAARAAGFAEASLGGHILRTETAVIAALAILNYALGDSTGLI